MQTNKRINESKLFFLEEFNVQTHKRSRQKTIQKPRAGATYVFKPANDHIARPQWLVRMVRPKLFEFLSLFWRHRRVGFRFLHATHVVRFEDEVEIAPGWRAFVARTSNARTRTNDFDEMA
jgi:hypothetical protein